VEEVDEFFGKREANLRQGSFFHDALATRRNLVEDPLPSRVFGVLRDLVDDVRFIRERASNLLSRQQDAEGSQEVRSPVHRVMGVVHIDGPRISFDILNDLNGECGKEASLYRERH